MTGIAPVVGFVVLGLACLLFLTGVPQVQLPDVGLGRPAELGTRLLCAACGAAPILSLSAAYAGFARLTLLLSVVVVPAYATVAIIALIWRDIGQGVVTGFVGGIVAVLVYDLMRLALSYSQGGKDPIPHIGVMLMGNGAPWWVGYLWRTLGNGAGLGIVYGVLCPRQWWGPKTGLAYASMVGLGMILTLWLFPLAQEQLFRLTWQTFVNSCLGHATYGLTLGAMARAARKKAARSPSTGRGRHSRPDTPTLVFKARRGAERRPGWAKD